MFYILDENKEIVTLADDEMKRFSKFMQSKDKGVDVTRINNVTISTVFLGIDHGFMEEEPILFETMVFGGKHNNYQDRCATYEGAVEMHKRAVQMVEKGKNNDG